MKRKLGPLPLWAWALIAGGTLGLIWYLRSSAGTTPTASTGPVLDPTAGAPPDVSGSGGGGGTTTAGDSGTTLDDLYAGLMNLDTDVKAIQAQGLTDNTDNTHTWQGDFSDVAGAIDTLRTTFGLHTDAEVQTATQKARASGKSAQKKADAGKSAAAARKARAAQKKADKAAAKKKSQGSGAAGKNQDNTPVRHTQGHTTPGAGRRGDGTNLNHARPTTARNVHGGNGQKKRTARPAARR